MARPRFRFPLQPKLTVAIQKRDALRDAVRQAQQQVAEAEKALQKSQQKLQQTVQRLRVARHHLTEPRHESAQGPARNRPMTAAQMAAAQRYLAALQAERSNQERAVNTQEEQLQWSRDRLTLLNEDLATAQGDVDLYESRLDDARKRHQRELDKYEQARRDDDAIQQWNRDRN